MTFDEFKAYRKEHPTSLPVGWAEMFDYLILRVEAAEKFCSTPPECNCAQDRAMRPRNAELEKMLDEAKTLVEARMKSAHIDPDRN